MSKVLKTLQGDLEKFVEKVETKTKWEPYILKLDKCCEYLCPNPLGDYKPNNPEFIYSNELPYFLFYKQNSTIASFVAFSELSIDLVEYFNKPEFQLVKIESHDSYTDNAAILYKGSNYYYLTISEGDLGPVCALKIFGSQYFIQNCVDEFKKYKIEKSDDKIEIGMVKNSDFGFDVRWFNIDKPNIDIELNYGSDFYNNHYPKIIQKLNTKKNGLFLFSSQPGQGKTFFIKHLVGLIDRKFIFLSDQVLSQGLDSPALIEILSLNRGCVVIIEDAEKYITSREENPNSLVSNLLNASDGILGDILNFSLILTHNMQKLEGIDAALTRKGRLLYQHEFKPLSVDEANKKLKSLNSDYLAKKPMSLAEIYNLEDNGYVKKEEKTIGFR